MFVVIMVFCVLCANSVRNRASAYDRVKPADQSKVAEHGRPVVPSHPLKSLIEQLIRKEVNTCFARTNDLVFEEQKDLVDEDRAPGKNAVTQSTGAGETKVFQREIGCLPSSAKSKNERETIGEPEAKRRKQVTWVDRIKELEDYKREHGRFDRDPRTEIRTPLCAWINKQRKSYSEGKLSVEKIKALNELGFPWNRTSHLNRVAWDDRIKELEDYKIKYGRFDRDPWTEKRTPLCDWIYTQRKSYSNGKLSVERIKALNELGFPWIRPSHLCPKSGRPYKEGAMKRRSAKHYEKERCRDLDTDVQAACVALCDLQNAAVVPV